jgi:hypothetical protein
MTLPRPLFPSTPYDGSDLEARVGGGGKAVFPAFTGKVGFACYHGTEGVWNG